MNQFYQQLPPITQDWTFGAGGKYRPGVDPMKDLRMWSGAQTNWLEELKRRTAQQGPQFRQAVAPRPQVYQPVTNFSQFLNQIGLSYPEIDMALKALEKNNWNSTNPTEERVLALVKKSMHKRMNPPSLSGLP